LTPPDEREGKDKETETLKLYKPKARRERGQRLKRLAELTRRRKKSRKGKGKTRTSSVLLLSALNSSGKKKKPEGKPAQYSYMCPVADGRGEEADAAFLTFLPFQPKKGEEGKEEGERGASYSLVCARREKERALRIETRRIRSPQEVRKKKKNE